MNELIERPHPPEQAAPLSFAQQRLWLLDRLLPTGSVYNIEHVLRISGELDPAALRGALNELVRRHEVLRTRFGMQDGQPVQVIAPKLRIALAIEDLLECAPDKRANEAQRRAQAEAEAPFDLANGPLIRARLLRLTPSEHWLLLTLHHIVTDGWSSGVLRRELTTLYNAYHRGEPSPLPELPVQYADYALWQRQWLQGAVLEKQLGFWRQALAGLPILDLPTDRPRPAEASYRGGCVNFDVPESLTHSLKALSRREGATLFMTLLAAYQILLFRYSGQEDIAVGVPIAGRTRLEVEGMIGFFVNTLVLRGDLSGEPSFKTYLAQVQARALDAYEHQDLPFEKLVEDLAPKRDLSRNPLFQASLVLQNTPPEHWQLLGLDVQRVEGIRSPTAKFDLAASVTESGGRLLGRLEYATDLFDPVTIERMARHFTTLLEGIVAQPKAPITLLPMLTADEREQLLVTWNDTTVAYRRDQCIQQFFEEQAARTPEAVAVVFETQQLTYAELNARANQLAHHLRTLAVGPEVLVGICLERSLELVIGLLGILKAGGAYVPLDPSYPTQRLAFMLQDSQAPVLLTEERLLDLLPPHAGRTLCLDRDWPTVAAQPATNPSATATATHLAYVIYTSGSTGTPKGVLVTHANVARLFSATRQWFDFNENDVWTCFHSFAFDFSVWEIWGALLHGGKLIVVPYLVSRDPDAFHALLRREHVTVLNQTPSAFRQLMAADARTNAGSDLGLRLVIFGGEALELQSLRPWFDRHDDARPRLVNMYGITETTVHVTYRLLRRADLDMAKGSMIGERIPDLRVYLVDRHLQPVPIGVGGEIVVGGAGVARGYLNRAELTAERFVADPFTSDTEARMYRSGDLARFTPSGDLEYLGRIDDQVKIRGFRIELGEIEAVLAQQPQVREAVVLLREDIPGNPRLVAYLVPQGETLPLADLRATLKQQLPDYMVPAAFVPLPALPLTPNGKIDRKALPAPQGGTEATPLSPPRNPVEEAVARIWCELLHLRQVGVHDNFFDLGGHSLLAIQMLSWLRDVFGIELSVRALFNAPTIGELAGQLSTGLAGGDEHRALPLKPLPRTTQLPLSFAQQRLWFLDQWEGASALYNIGQGWWLQGPMEVARLRKAVSQLIARHESLRTAFVSTQGQPRQQVLADVAVELPLVDLSALPAEQARAQALVQAAALARQGFDLTQAPLLRLTLLRVTQSTHLLVLVMHHIVSDGWSMGVFFRELAALYAGRGEQPPALPVQYPDYAQWQRADLQGAALERQLAYWRDRLAGLTTLELPTDRPRQPTQSYRGARHALALPADLSAALEQLSRCERVTLYMLLLAAFQVLLARYSGQDDIAVGSPIAGRTRREFEDLIGFFANTLVLRSDLSGNPRFCDLLARVRESALDAYAHQDVPFEKLVEELKPERDVSRNPLFQVMFVLQNAPSGGLTLPGLEVTAQALETATAKFDLLLTLREGPAGLRGTLEYATDLFDAVTIERLAGHWQMLLTGIVADPQQQISHLPLLTPPERHQLLVEWNDTTADYPWDPCIQQLFEQQVERTPEAVAVVFGKAQLTYRELNARANQLAHHLRTLGVGPEVLVGICLERSLDLAVGLLGILKAGGAYVPLDPDYPAQRLAFMLGDTQAPVLLTQERLLGQLPPHAGRTLCLDRDWLAVAAAQPATNPSANATATNLAYVIYTSGSSGMPKGVMVEHRTLSNCLGWMNHNFSFKPDDRVLQSTPISFDMSIVELFIPLISGAQLVMAEPGAHRDVGALCDLVWHHQITVLQVVPSMLAIIVDGSRLTKLTSLLRVLTAGEALGAELVRRFHAQSRAELINGYGPTETFYSTFWTCRREDTGQSIPIGRPVGNTQAYVLDRYLQPAPVGVPGELCFGGTAVARGYLNRPDLTIERFVPDSFASDARARMYRTGDRARFLPDGNIEYLGRVDAQVKLRGFRIELGEIEATLVRHPVVREAVVLLREDVPGNQRLVAYVVGREEGLAASDLRAWLRQQLPDYMVPAAFVLLPALPLTPNGKVNRKVLPVPERGTRKSAHDLPATPMESIVAEIWANVLNHTSVGIDDDFFDLGGHSLLAVQLLNRINQALQVDLTLRQLFATPTVRALALAALEGMVAGTDDDVTLQPNAAVR